MDEPNSEPSTSPDTIGNTQLVPLIKVPKHSGMKCQVRIHSWCTVIIISFRMSTDYLIADNYIQIFAKLEFRNKPSKSIYDRLALALINKAELAGIMEPGWLYTLIHFLIIIMIGKIVQFHPTLMAG